MYDSNAKRLIRSMTNLQEWCDRKIGPVFYKMRAIQPAVVKYNNK